MSVATLGWQEIAQALSTKARKDSRTNGSRRGRRQISQDTVRQIRVDIKVMTRVEVARKHHVSPHYVYLVTECGLRDDERENLR